MNNKKVVSMRWFLMVCLAAASSFAVDITFFSISDTHYGNVGAPTSGTGITQKDTSRARMPGILNNLPGTAYPTSVGGTVGTPRGVLIPGDLIENPDTTLWVKYIADYGVNGGMKMQFPVFDGTGNHDRPGVSDVVYSRLVARNATRQFVVNYDSLGYNYSWDWDGVHFVQLNLYAGGNETGYFTTSGGGNSMNSRGFLIQDLATRVGGSGRPIVIMQHYPMTDSTFFVPAARNLFYSAILNYNVIAIIHGHSHAQKIYTWNNGSGSQTFDVYDDGTVMDGDVMVFHITDGRMVATHRSFVGTGTSGNGAQQWSTLIKDKTISMGTATSITNSFGDRAGLFRVAGTSLRMPASARAIEIMDVRGRVVRRLPVNNQVAEWDRRDAKGALAPAGVYFLRSAGRIKAFGKIALR